MLKLPVFEARRGFESISVDETANGLLGRWRVSFHFLFLGAGAGGLRFKNKQKTEKVMYKCHETQLIEVTVRRYS